MFPLLLLLGLFVAVSAARSAASSSSSSPATPPPPSDQADPASSGSMVWQNMPPDQGGDFQFAAGHRYAMLVSLSLDYSVEDLEKKITAAGGNVTYAWEWGQPTRGEYAIDDWLANLPADTHANHRWVYGEADNGKDASLSQDSPWPTTIYHVDRVMEAVPA